MFSDVIDPLDDVAKGVLGGTAARHPPVVGQTQPVGHLVTKAGQYGKVTPVL